MTLQAHRVRVAEPDGEQGPVTPEVKLVCVVAAAEETSPAVAAFVAALEDSPARTGAVQLVTDDFVTAEGFVVDSVIPC